jgi:hypothetical protein
MMVAEGRAHVSALTIFSPDALTRPACQIFSFHNDLKELVGKGVSEASEHLQSARCARCHTPQAWWGLPASLSDGLVRPRRWALT